MSPDDPRHGERRGYYAHRKDGEEACDACKRAAAAAEARRVWNLMQGKPGRVPAVGTTRRIQALVRLGYDMVTLGREIGCEPMMVKKWADRTAADDYVFWDTRERVAAVYERLAMHLPPTETTGQRNAVTRSRRRAERKGWPPPLAWDNPDDPDEMPKGWRRPSAGEDVDPIVVQRLLELQRVRSTRAEKVEAMRQWRAMGRSEKSLCDAHGWGYSRYVTREDGAA